MICGPPIELARIQMAMRLVSKDPVAAVASGCW
jgi:hypothetical protein